MDVCVVLYRSDASRITPGLRDGDKLFVVDNTKNNMGFAAGANAAAAEGEDESICFVNPDGDLTRGCLDALEKALEDTSVVAAEAVTGRPVGRLPNGDLEWIAGTCVAVRRAAFTAVGGFDERLFMYAEDRDLSYRLREHGRFVLATAARYENHDWNHELSLRSIFYLARNNLIVDKRYERPAIRGALRDAIWPMKVGRWDVSAARALAVLDYAVRGRRWT